jgi:hypothetical protein
MSKRRKTNGSLINYYWWWLKSDTWKHMLIKV